MSTTFISRKGGGTGSGIIVLWYGAKADIPVGWAYYAPAANKMVIGALVANASTFGDATHTHSYSQATGGSGSHTHAISVSIGQPINATVPGHYSGGTKNAEWADRYHTNHSSSVTVSLDSGHIHSLGNTGGAANIPPAFGLYFIRKT